MNIGPDPVPYAAVTRTGYSSAFIAAIVAMGIALPGGLTHATEKEGATPVSRAAVANWPLEHVRLANGKEYEGLIANEGETSIEFVEVHRQAGKPMFLLVRPIDRRSIADWRRLDEQQRRDLESRIDQFKNRSRVEARRMSDLRLTAVRRDDVVTWQYQGDWFSLDSTADEQTSRRSIVSIEQVFMAFRQILPPRQSPQRRLRIELFGSTDQYRSFLRGCGLEIDNPAFFVADFNLLAAGSEMNRFVAELTRVRKQHQAVMENYDRQIKDLPNRLKQLGDDLQKANFPPAERQKILLAEQKRLEDERRGVQQEIQRMDRKNAARFREVSGVMFTRLYHEAFHAYLENYVYPHQDYDVPRWLNEGLAQVFESGLLESDTLRVDVPNPRALAALQSDLAGPEPLSLSDLLLADANTFLAAHRENSAGASRLYYYSWGLAYYLTFEQSRLGQPAFEAYISPAAAQRPAVPRFEQLIGMPLSEFEPAWREAMRKLK